MSHSVEPGWTSALQKYEMVIHTNAQRRVAKMSEADMHRYCCLYGMTDRSRAAIVAHLIESSANSRMGNIAQSPLMGRLLRGEQVFDHAPPTCFGHTWHDLVESRGATFNCFVKVLGLGRRERDKSQGVWLFDINDCVWECRGSTTSGLRFIELDQMWSLAKRQERQSMIPDLLAFLRTEGATIAFDMQYGDWGAAFTVKMDFAQDSQDDEDWLVYALPQDGGLFGCARVGRGCPFFWTIGRKSS